MSVYTIRQAAGCPSINKGKQLDVRLLYTIKALCRMSVSTTNLNCWMSVFLATSGVLGIMTRTLKIMTAHGPPHPACSTRPHPACGSLPPPSVQHATPTQRAAHDPHSACGTRPQPSVQHMTPTQRAAHDHQPPSLLLSCVGNVLGL